MDTREKRLPGRPAKGSRPRVPRTYNMDQAAIELLDAHAMPGETPSDVINRAVLAALDPMARATTKDQQAAPSKLDTARQAMQSAGYQAIDLSREPVRRVDKPGKKR